MLLLLYNMLILGSVVVLQEASATSLLLVQIHVGIHLALGHSLSSMIAKVALYSSRPQRPLHGTHAHLLLL